MYALLFFFFVANFETSFFFHTYRCNKVGKCKILASSLHFGSPCGDSTHVLEVNYVCLKDLIVESTIQTTKTTTTTTVGTTKTTTIIKNIEAQKVNIKLIIEAIYL